jgi:hypothetical protein
VALVKEVFNCPPRLTLKSGAFELIGWRAGSSFIDVVPNAPPSNGIVTCEPAAGTAAVTTFAMAAAGWSDDDMPLDYRFGVEAEATLIYLSDFGADNVTAFLPAGQPEQDYVLHVVVEAADSLGARATATIDVRFGAHYLPYPAVLDIPGVLFYGL